MLRFYEFVRDGKEGPQVLLLAERKRGENGFVGPGLSPATVLSG